MKEVVKACPKCHRLMKSAVINGRNVWICVNCGTKMEDITSENENSIRDGYTVA